MMILSRRKRLSIGMAASIIVIAAASALFLYRTRSRAVLCTLYEEGNPLHEPYLVILNPFRDRGPERSAEKFLELMRSGECLQAMATIATDDVYRNRVCERETEEPLMTWRLKNRSERDGSVRLYFWCQSKAAGDSGPLWVTVARGEFGWGVAAYERYY